MVHSTAKSNLFQGLTFLVPQHPGWTTNSEKKKNTRNHGESSFPHQNQHKISQTSPKIKQQAKTA